MSPRLAAIAAVLAAAACSKSKPHEKDTAPAPPPPPPIHDTTGGAATGAPEGAGTGSAAAPDDTTDSSYQFVAQHPAPAAAGSDEVARLIVHPGSGYHINKDYPTKLTLEPPAGVTLAKTVYDPLETPADAEKFDEGELAIAVSMKATGKGEYTVPGLLKFAVCTESTCNPKKKKVALVLKAE